MQRERERFVSFRVTEAELRVLKLAFGDNLAGGVREAAVRAAVEVLEAVEREHGDELVKEPP